MAEVIRMPLLSDTMKEGIIAEWHKKVGDKVKADDVLADVETDKATMEVMGYAEGVLLYIGVEKGKAAKVNDIIAIVGKPGEDFKSLLKEKPAGTPAPGEAKPAKASPPPSPAPDTAGKPSGQPAPEALLKEVTVVRMPLLSDTMKEGKIVEWHKKTGDPVKSDDVLADVETDKATMEVMGYADGTLLYIGVEKGQSAKVNDIIAIIGKAGTNVQPILDADKSMVAPTQEGAKPAGGSKNPETPAKESPLPSQDPDSRVKSSPLARKLASEKGIDISQVRGSGDEGRIVKRDVDSFVPQASTVFATKGVPVTLIPTIRGQEGYKDLEISQMRKTIARRLSESKFSAPHFYLVSEIKMDSAIVARQTINEASPVKVSFNDLVIKASACALQRHPEVNSSWMGDFIRQYQHIHIGSAVAMEEGLIVPVIRFADQKSLSQIAAEASQLYEKARHKKLQPPDFTGNTFTVSNLGMLDIDEFTAIINPPDSCILAVGKIKEVPVVENGQINIASVMKLTLSCDHRIVDGATGARFLQTLKGFLENPVTMLV